MRPRLGLVVVHVAFALSGVAALVLETVWLRQLSLAFGSTMPAVTLVLATFMGGLALGSLLGGRFIDRQARVDPLRAFAALEAAAALVAVALTLALWRFDALAQGLAGLTESDAGRAAGRFGIGALALGVPTVLMGASLPVLARALVFELRRRGRVIGRLYVVNTLGAAAGCLLAEGVLIPALGLTRTAMLAATLDVVAAGSAVVVAAWLWPQTTRQRAARVSKRAPQGGASLESPLPCESARGEGRGAARSPASDASLAGRLSLLGAFATVGFGGMAGEVVWTRAQIFAWGPRRQVFAWVVATILLGLVAGGWVAARLADRLSAAQARRALALVLVIGALLGAATLALVYAPLDVRALALGAAEALTADPTRAFTLGIALSCLAVLGLPAAVAGLALPLAVRAAVSERRTLGTRLGGLYAANTAGGIAGVLLAGLLLLPAFGMQRTLLSVAAVEALVGLTLWLGTRAAAAPVPEAARAIARAAGTLRRWWPAPLVLGLLVLAVALPGDWARRHAYAGFAGRVLQTREGLHESLAVIEAERFGVAHHRALVTNGHSMSTNAASARRYMEFMALLPLALSESPRDACLICYGVGNTARALTQDARLKRLDVVDLSPEVPLTARFFFREPGSSPLADPRVRLIADDGRNRLLLAPDRYDLITFEPPPPSLAGVGNLYSREYYALCRARLKPGGMVTQWLPLDSLTAADARAAIRAFTDAFPYASLWHGYLFDLVLLGAQTPVALDAGAIGARLAQQPGLARALRGIGVTSPENLLAQLLLDDADLRAYVRDATPLSDDRPRLEYHFPALVAPKERYDPWLFEAWRPARVRRATGVDAKRFARELATARLVYDSCFTRTPFAGTYQRLRALERAPGNALLQTLAGLDAQTLAAAVAADAKPAGKKHTAAAHGLRARRALFVSGDAREALAWLSRDPATARWARQDAALAVTGLYAYARLGLSDAGAEWAESLAQFADPAAQRAVDTLVDELAFGEPSLAALPPLTPADSHAGR